MEQEYVTPIPLPEQFDPMPHPPNEDDDAQFTISLGELGLDMSDFESDKPLGTWGGNRVKQHLLDNMHKPVFHVQDSSSNKAVIGPLGI